MMAQSYQTISILQERKIYLGPIYLDLKSILLVSIELHISALLSVYHPSFDDYLVADMVGWSESEPSFLTYFFRF